LVADLWVVVAVTETGALCEEDMGNNNMAKRIKKVGRPAFKPTAEQTTMVLTLSGYGIPENQIRLLVINPETGEPITEKTLRKHFRHELDTGFVKANAKVAETLWKQAVSGNVGACIWWTKCRMGWHEGHMEKESQVAEYEQIRDPGELAKLTARELVTLYRSEVAATEAS
jgi:hypothetical protein